MLADLPRACDVGQAQRQGPLLDRVLARRYADGGIPILLASTHDSQVAIPLGDPDLRRVGAAFSRASIAVASREMCRSRWRIHRPRNQASHADVNPRLARQIGKGPRSVASLGRPAAPLQPHSRQSRRASTYKSARSGPSGMSNTGGSRMSPPRRPTWPPCPRDEERVRQGSRPPHVRQTADGQPADAPSFRRSSPAPLLRHRWPHSRKTVRENSC